jgi:hypothetical protein
VTSLPFWQFKSRHDLQINPFELSGHFVQTGGALRGMQMVGLGDKLPRFSLQSKVYCLSQHPTEGDVGKAGFRVSAANVTMESGEPDLFEH